MAENKIKYKYYTNGVKSIRIPDTETPPDGFFPGRIRNYSEESKKRQAEKTRQTKLARYGDERYNNIQQGQQTKIDRYGASQNFEKIKEVCLERYGVANPFAVDKIKDKIKNTMLERYGVENISQAETNKEKIRKSWECKSQEELNAILEKRQQTSFEKYGVANAAGCIEVQEKIKQTCLQKYGVEYFCMTDACRSHSSNESAPNKQFEKILANNNIQFSREFSIENKSYDFKIINDNILIEIDPTATHNSTWGIFNRSGLDKNYHHDKTKLAKLNDYRCIHIFDWDNMDKIIELLKRKDSIYARNCELKELSTKETNIFLNKYHLQGTCKSEIKLGLFYNEVLVSVMTFGKSRYNKKYQWELLRYASNINIVGGANKLFKYFLNVYKPESIISYCDFSKFNGNIYEKLGFKYEGYTIGKHWYNLRTKVHITDNLLRQRGFDQLLGKEYGTFGKGTDNEDLMKQFGFVEVYDAGQGKYTFKK